ncbi:hypothetical protein EB796_018371 [Bugula neritina]|uniref:Uncharacterized protein n=1 Tax=Bugula neritina TaxID=10212 RepID=A0A7J7JCE5_BUGNE|nr:hypothetical protein EB796_018371 [Bugula neritina]
MPTLTVESFAFGLFEFIFIHMRVGFDDGLTSLEGRHYKYLEPVQSPISPPYKEACDKKKGNQNVTVKSDSDNNIQNG